MIKIIRDILKQEIIVKVINVDNRSKPKDMTPAYQSRFPGFDPQRH